MTSASERHARVLIIEAWAARQAEPFTAADLAGRFGLAKHTATFLLRSWVRRGLVVRNVGSGTNVEYRPAPAPRPP